MDDFKRIGVSVHEVNNLKKAHHATATDISPRVWALEAYLLPVAPDLGRALLCQEKVDAVHHLVVLCVVGILQLITARAWDTMAK
jgi:hypothetical protein